MKPHLGARLKRRPAQSFALPPVLFSNAGLAPPASPAQGLLAERCSPQHVRSQSAAFHNELSLSPCMHVQPASQRGAPLAAGVARVAGDTSLRPAFCSCRPGPHPPPWAARPCLCPRRPFTAGDTASSAAIDDVLHRKAITTMPDPCCYTIRSLVAVRQQAK